MKEIPVGKKYVALVDDEDYERVSASKWFYNTGKSTIYAIRNRMKPMYLHRLVLNILDPKVQVDHINYNGLDCRKANLRLCNSGQNTVHQRKRTNAIHSKFKGVTWCSRHSKWLSRIHKQGKHMHLGYFESEAEAAQKYNRAALELYGEYAVLNEVESVVAKGQ